MTSDPKILFLDIDGPMVPGRSLLMPGNCPGFWGWTFDPVAVSMINFMDFAIPDFQIVLSTHRIGADLKGPYRDFQNVESKEFWEYHFLLQGITASFHDDWVTPRHYEDGEYIRRAKWEEIEDWLEAHPNVTQFATVEDDMNDKQSVSSAMRKKFHLYGESYDNGITWRDFIGICGEFGLMNAKAKYQEYSKQFLSV